MVLGALDENELACDVQELNSEDDTLPSERALGVIWNVASDTFGYKIKAGSPYVSARTAFVDLLDLRSIRIRWTRNPSRQAHVTRALPSGVSLGLRNTRRFENRLAAMEE